MAVLIVALTAPRPGAYGLKIEIIILGQRNRPQHGHIAAFFDIMDMKGRRMGRLEAAADRLDKALADLEAALARRAERESESFVGRLQSDLDRLRGEHAGLRDTANAVVGRLDTLAERLDGLLETESAAGASQGTHG